MVIHISLPRIDRLAITLVTAIPFSLVLPCPQRLLHPSRWRPSASYASPSAINQATRMPRASQPDIFSQNRANPIEPRIGPTQNTKTAGLDEADRPPRRTILNTQAG